MRDSSLEHLNIFAEKAGDDEDEPVGSAFHINLGSGGASLGIVCVLSKDDLDRRKLEATNWGFMTLRRYRLANRSLPEAQKSATGCRSL